MNYTKNLLLFSQIIKSFRLIPLHNKQWRIHVDVYEVVNAINYLQTKNGNWMQSNALIFLIIHNSMVYIPPYMKQGDDDHKQCGRN